MLVCSSVSRLDGFDILLVGLYFITVYVASIAQLALNMNYVTEIQT